MGRFRRDDLEQDIDGEFRHAFFGGEQFREKRNGVGVPFFECEITCVENLETAVVRR